MRGGLLVLVAGLALAAPTALSASAPPKVVARAVLVQNGATGETLVRYRDRAKLPIASITKLMTVLVALERSRPEEVVTVAAGASGIGESTIDLRAGERLTVADLVKAALIQSANDAAYALAYHAGRGSVEAFVRLMNTRARSLRLTDTRFVRPDGLDVVGHVSSARDVTKLARVVMNVPLVRAIVRRRTETIAGGRRLHTWNDLLASFPGLVGVKTGHTSAAGWSQVAAASEPGVTVYATLLGSPSRGRRNVDLARLLRWALGRYRPAVIVSPKRVYARVPTQYGRGPVELVPTRRLFRSIRVDRPLVERVVVPIRVPLPVERGVRLGEVRVYDRGRLLGRRPLVAAESITRPDFGGRTRWYATRAMEHVWSWIT